MKKLIKNQNGQGIMEYVIISSLIGICCLTVVGQFGKAINQRIDEMKQRVVKEISVTSDKK